MAQYGADFGGSMPEYYDRVLGPAQFDPFAAELVRRLPARPGGDVLEIACGTGLVTRRLRARLDPAVRLHASDLSEAMLSYARNQVPGAIEWRTADATALPFDDAAYAAVVCAFGIMFVPDKPRAFREMRRVLRPGGTLLFNVWQDIERNAHGRIASEVLERLFPGDPEMRGARAPYEFHDRERIRRLVEGAGFGTPRFDDVRIPIRAPTARHYATGILRGTPRGLLLQNRGVDLEVLIDEYAAELAREGGAEPLELEANATFVQAEALPL
jgi:ubiquinone/menaquinone biosynthesis C-methylase UbiE